MSVTALDAADETGEASTDGPRWTNTAREFFFRASGGVRLMIALFGALAVFGIIMLLKGVDPITAYQEMFSSTFHSWDSIGDILVRATPIILAALAVSVPARAGMINVGGEGQLLMGGIAAM